MGFDDGLLLQDHLDLVEFLGGGEWCLHPLCGSGFDGPRVWLVRGVWVESPWVEFEDRMRAVKSVPMWGGWVSSLVSLEDGRTVVCGFDGRDFWVCCYLDGYGAEERRWDLDCVGPDVIRGEVGVLVEEFLGEECDGEEA